MATTKCYEFSVCMYGWGETPEDAWEKAVRGLNEEPGPVPGTRDADFKPDPIERCVVVDEQEEVRESG